jgi:hypothetical protein
MDLYIEPFSGISGDMFLGALCALSGEYRRIEGLPAALGLEDARVELKDVVKQGIRCRRVCITDLAAAPARAAGEGVQRRHPNRNLDGLLEIVDRSGIAAGAKRISREILTSLAEAEAEVHGVPVGQVHFHEVGAVDSLLDIVGCAVLLDLLAVRQSYSDPVCTGFGSVRTRHGPLPVPAPATAALLRGMPTFKGDEPPPSRATSPASGRRRRAPRFCGFSLRPSAPRSSRRKRSPTVRVRRTSRHRTCCGCPWSQPLPHPTRRRASWCWSATSTTRRPSCWGGTCRTT